MSLSEAKLISWTKPSSDHEESMCDRSARMIESALWNYAPLEQREYIVISQGSYHNNTNVRLSSDVDVCIAFTDVIQSSYHYTPDWNSQRMGFTRSDRLFSDDRELIRKALIQTFGANGIRSGGKAFEILANQGTRVNADAVPAWRFAGWSPSASGDRPSRREGVTFWTTEGKQVINFPEQHYTNGKNKNNRTGRAFKRATRILKRIRYDMLDNDDPIADGLASFTIESAIYNVPDDTFDRNSWTQVMRDVLYYMDVALYNGSASKEWVEVSGMKWMFKDNYGIPSNWSVANLRKFTQAARELIG
ncbi:hypothetical protein FNU79_17775 [Deinococcus detaillensis]|uniref:cGAS/DncV-like nucleotidyltransferase C-terminal helical domain-containing protein n=1 Tax=Deinococcus detaillensis TaxID=2592048 RepID=A0A553UH48_9DEIO|nr:hypothetical protein [Deinococcus detaillensis]TSA79540.1 hypothetical protein FNU79_17775 [Deinococcus detaillensis]